MLDARNPTEPYRRASSRSCASALRATIERDDRGYARRRRSCSTTCALVERALREGARHVRGRRRPARRDPPGRGLRLPLRDARHPRARRAPPQRDGRDPRHARRHDDYGDAVAGARIALLCRDDRRSPAADPRRHPRLLREHAGGDRDVPDASRRARRRSTAARSRPTSSPAPKAPPTCSRCCC